MGREKIIIDKTPTATYFGFTELRYSDKLEEDVWRILKQDKSVADVSDFKYPEGKDSYFYKWSERLTYNYK